MDSGTVEITQRALVKKGLLRAVLMLALPVMAEQMLNMMVGLTDTYVANHLRDKSVVAASAAAVGTIGYITWFIGLLTGAVGTGSTALVARATGARHRSLANSVCGQSVMAAVVVGIFLGVATYIFAPTIVRLTALPSNAQGFALSYIKLFAFAIPLMMLQFIGSACLRGAGDTTTPAKVMAIVGVVNIFCSIGLTYGRWGLPELGFNGIAAGTVIAYTIGGLIQLYVLISGRGGVRLHLHRLRPHFETIRRVLRIGIPSGVEGLMIWLAQFGVVIVINAVDETSRMGAAHVNTIRIESISFLSGFAFAMAAATLVGQNLGRHDRTAAERAGYLSYLAGGTVMVVMGVLFVFFAQIPAGWIAEDPAVAALTAQCLRITGTTQIVFAASMIFAGALRGAGDTVAVMLINLSSVVGVRFVGVMIVGWWLRMGLAAIWVVLCCELVVRGLLIFGRFYHGKWKTIRV